MTNAKEKLWNAYVDHSLRAEALFAGLKLIETKFTSTRNLKQHEINVIIEIAENVGMVIGDKRQLCLNKRGKE